MLYLFFSWLALIAVQISWRISNLGKEVTFSNIGARKVEFDLNDNREDGELSGVGLG